ncbi:MAG: biopolymer transporter ExbD [Oleiphilaceae bacterium]|nr:biopolymer transporter ExbD [Oleiphilaceae bacterium]
MKLSRRAKRMKRHYSRMHRAGGLNLVSLMDIFTILVFFLMVNSSDVKVLQQDSKVQLPSSTAEAQPEEQLIVVIYNQQVMVQGRPVASLQDKNDPALVGLKNELAYQAGRQAGQETESPKALTLIADKNTPYSDLKRVMTACTEAGYVNVSLAVQRQADVKEG